jgi:class 3 adenylate cyclase/predicted ATPase
MNIGEWLHDLGLAQYEEAFRHNDVDEEVLRKLTADDLRELGVASIGHRRRLLEAIAMLSGGLATPAETPAIIESAPTTGTLAREAERRQLTVMFCDLVGSTALSTRHDPEDLGELIGAYQRAVLDTVSRFDGFVAKYMGDGVLIYFGYPQAHEDDAERAVRAGLAVIEAVGQLPTREELSVRLGIATGLAVVGDLIGEGAAQERGVVGETPNLAARLQALAEPNTMIAAEATRRQIGGLFDLEDLGPQRLAGFGELQRAWRVIGESGMLSRFEALRSGETPLVGRGEELDLLLRRWEQAKTGEGRVVLLSGEPGIGKSRLTAALSEQVGTEPHIRLRYFCSPHHQDSALYPFTAQLERAAGFARDEEVDAKLGKLRALLAPGARDDDDIPLLSELLSLPNSAAEPNLSPQRKREKLLEALLSQLEAEARRRPVLMVFEDAHWIDPTSRELLDLTIDRVRHLPVLLVITFRPEFQPTWGGRSDVTSLVLNRLGERDGEALVQTLAGNVALTAEIVSEIVERTDGVPLFVEELTKAVLENAEQGDRVAAVLATTSLAAQSVPATLHASLMARLDRLGTAAKEIAQIGAVLGREFSYELIEPVAQRPAPELRTALGLLSDAALLFQRGVPPNSSYLFKHALVQDAAYGTLLRSRRRQLHGFVAEVLREQFPETEERRPEILAHHFTEAGRADLAIHYWQKAGERALQRSANAEASAHLRAAIGVIVSLPADSELRRKELGLQMALGSATRAIRGHAADETIQVYSRARDLLDDTIPIKDQMAVLYGLWTVNVVRAEYIPALDAAEQSLALASRFQDPEASAFANRMMGFTLWSTGAFADSIPHWDRTVALYAPGQENVTDLRYSQDHAVWALSMLALTLWPLGHPARATAAATTALGWARTIQHAMTTGFALSFGSLLNGFLQADPEENRIFADEAVAYCVENDLRAYIPWARFYQGQTLARSGKYRQGLDLMRAAMAGAEKINMKQRVSIHLGYLASAYASAGDPETGMDLLAQAIQVVEETGERFFEAELHRLCGEILIQMNRRDEAEAAFDRALAVARRQQARSWELRAAVSLARLRGEARRRAEARELLGPIYGWFTEGLDTADLKAARALLDELA